MENLFVQDATAAIYIYMLQHYLKATIGEVRIAGNRAVFNGLEQISGATVTIESSDNDLPALLSNWPTSLTAADHKRVEIEGLTVKHKVEEFSINWWN